MISLELMSEVLQRNILSYQVCDNTIIGETSDDKLFQGCAINIYELAHKCKEWALLYGYELNSCLVTKIANPKDYYATTLAVHSIKEPIFDANALSEPEAIFKACQWILDNKDSHG